MVSITTSTITDPEEAGTDAYSGCPASVRIWQCTELRATGNGHYHSSREKETVNHYLVLLGIIT